MPRLRLPPPNLPLPTLGGKQLWADQFVFARWRIQRSVMTGHCRLLDPADVRHAWGTYEQCLAAFDRRRAQRGAFLHGDRLVLLLHGIFRSKEALYPMARALRRAGFEAEPVNYPSTRRSLEQHARQVIRILDNVADYAESDLVSVSLVGHSMGGIVARMVESLPRASAKRLPIARLVTIGSPNRGAELVDRLMHRPEVQAAMGPAGLELAVSTFPDLPPPSCPFGVVAGARGDGKGWNPLLPGDNDMTVTLESALLAGAEDTLIVKSVHTMLPIDPAVIEAVVRYLDTGHFSA